MGVIGVDDAHDGDDESVGDSKGGESDGPRKRPSAGAMGISDDGPSPCPCESSWACVELGASGGGVFGLRPKSERVNAELEWAVLLLAELGRLLIIG